MWPSSPIISAQAPGQQMPMYTTQPYVAAPQDMYSHAAAAAAAAAGFDGWAIAQAAAHAQGYAGVNHVGPPHMLQPHLAAAGHGMGHPMLPSPQHHHMMTGGHHPGMAQQAAANPPANAAAMMMHWGHHPGMQPPPMTGIVAGGHMVGVSDSGRSSSWQQSGRGGGGSYNGNNSIHGMARHAVGPGQQQHGRGGRSRRNIVLNTKPGDFSDAAVEEFARAVKRTPASEQLDQKMLAEGLQNLDSRGLAALLKDLAKCNHGRRAREVFQFLRELPPSHALAQLCDVFTYTAMVSLCVEQQQLNRALELVAEMKQRNIERNVHTYTALMNVAIKCGQLQKALEVYNDLLREGCMPNVVTYNTLIDLYGKTGQWNEALRVIDQMNGSNVNPVTRTYNTLMIACNTSGQWQEALNVYSEMLRLGHAPNTTTYNALISAHSKAGRLEKVMEVYQEMLRNGCERTVITYSALISACEKAGQWQLALNLFSEMLKERCSPNVITYNSLITACAQGAQWGKAADIFQQMKKDSSCKPDVVTYTALVTAYERGGQWMKALEAFQQMQQQGCSADAILYNTLLDILWDTGVAWAQHKAGQLFRQAMDGGHFRLLPQPQQQQQQLQHGPDSRAAAATRSGEPSSPAALSVGSASSSPTAPAAAAASAAAAAAAASAGSSKIELGMQGVSPGVAMLMLHCWLADLRDGVLQHQQQHHHQQQQVSCYLPERVVVSTGRSRQRDHVSGILRDSTVALLSSWQSPFSPMNAEGNSSSKLEAPGPAVADWLLRDKIQRLLAPFSRHARISGGGSTAELAAESALEKRCREAFSAVKTFENTHNLSVQSMGISYTAARAGLVALLLEAGVKLGIRNDVVHDAVLLMDRGMSAKLKVVDDTYPCLAAACLHLTAAHASLPTAAPSLQDICSALGCSSSQEAAGMAEQLSQQLKGDTSSVSALRCLKLYLERLGYDFQPDGSCSSAEDIADTMDLVSRAAMDSEFLNYRPTITAAAVLYCERLQKGLLPFWPSSLAGLTGYSNARTPELAAAINGAQRLCKQLLSKKKGASSADGGGSGEQVSGTASGSSAADAPAAGADANADAAAAGAGANQLGTPDAEVAVTDVDELSSKLATSSVTNTAAAAVAAMPQ